MEMRVPGLMCFRYSEISYLRSRIFAETLQPQLNLAKAFFLDLQKLLPHRELFILDPTASKSQNGTIQQFGSRRWGQGERAQPCANALGGLIPRPQAPLSGAGRKAVFALAAFYFHHNPVGLGPGISSHRHSFLTKEPLATGKLYHDRSQAVA